MSNEKALAIIPSTVDEVSTLSSRFAKSSLLPADLRGKEVDVFVTILAGQELGMPPMAALRGIHVVKGKPILSADAMVGVVLGRGVAEYFMCTAESNTSVTYETKRVGAPRSQSCTWTIEDAKRAGLNGDNWGKYPRQMLKARCKAMLARDVYPDVLAGCYEESERGEIENLPAEVKEPEAVDAEIIQPPPAFDIDGALTALRDAETVDDLRRLAGEFKAAPDAHKPKLRAEYERRVAELGKAK